MTWNKRRRSIFFFFFFYFYYNDWENKERSILRGKNKIKVNFFLLVYYWNIFKIYFNTRNSSFSLNFKANTSLNLQQNKIIKYFFIQVFKRFFIFMALNYTALSIFYNFHSIFFFFTLRIINSPEKFTVEVEKKKTANIKNILKFKN